MRQLFSDIRQNRQRKSRIPERVKTPMMPMIILIFLAGRHLHPKAERMDPTWGSTVSLRQGISLKSGLLTWQGYVRERSRVKKEHQKSLEESHLVISQMIAVPAQGKASQNLTINDA